MTPPFTPDQESRLRDLIREELELRDTARTAPLADVLRQFKPTPAVRRFPLSKTGAQ